VGCKKYILHVFFFRGENTMKKVLIGVLALFVLGIMATAAPATGNNSKALNWNGPALMKANMGGGHGQAATNPKHDKAPAKDVAKPRDKDKDKDKAKDKAKHHKKHPAKHHPKQKHHKKHHKPTAKPPANPQSNGGAPGK
jgi:outer membrane biosynthesis protein TonB